MATIILAVALIALAIYSMAKSISINALLYYMDEKGYPFPTKEEQRELTEKVTREMFFRKSNRR